MLGDVPVERIARHAHGRGIPPSQGQALIDASRAPERRIVVAKRRCRVPPTGQTTAKRSNVH
jgi:hypothetical protein